MNEAISSFPFIPFPCPNPTRAISRAPSFPRNHASVCYIQKKGCSTRRAVSNHFDITVFTPSLTSNYLLISKPRSG